MKRLSNGEQSAQGLAEPGDRTTIDRELIRRLAVGGSSTESACKSLYRAYRRKLIGFLVHLGADAGTAEDLVQECFVRVVRSAGSFRDEARVSSWIHQIARNLYYDRLRAQRPEDVLDDEQWAQVADTVSTASSSDCEQSLQDCMEAGFSRFADMHRDRAEVLRCVVNENWSLREVAVLLGRSEGATREYVSQCRKKLKPFIEPCLEFLKE